MKRITWLGLFLSLAASPLLGLLLGQARAGGGETPIAATLLTDWGLALALLALVRWGERLPPASIGWQRPTWQDVGWGTLGFLIGALLFACTAPLLQAVGLGNTNAGIARLAQSSPATRLLIVVTAAVTEEILFRGYPIERLTTLTGRLPLAAVLTWALFTLLHLPFWGWGGALQIGLWSGIVVWLYARRRRLFACIWMHLLNDAYAFLLLPALLPTYLPR